MKYLYNGPRKQERIGGRLIRLFPGCTSTNDEVVGKPGWQPVPESKSAIQQEDKSIQSLGEVAGEDKGGESGEAPTDPPSGSRRRYRRAGKH